jgi:hypothetical protein
MSLRTPVGVLALPMMEKLIEAGRECGAPIELGDHEFAQLLSEMHAIYTLPIVLLDEVCKFLNDAHATQLQLALGDEVRRIRSERQRAYLETSEPGGHA